MRIQCDSRENTFSYNKTCEKLLTNPLSVLYFSRLRILTTHALSHCLIFATQEIKEYDNQL